LAYYGQALARRALAFGQQRFDDLLAGLDRAGIGLL
jgi:hypothetical protein